jgi:hypothetical protein
LAELTGSLVDTACLGSGLGTVYRALDHLVDGYSLTDASLVLELPGLGRQVLRAGRRPLGDDEGHLHDAPIGLHTEPRLDDPVLDELMVALAALGLRYDARPDPEPRGLQVGS